jgi:ABC-type enterochelin transport system ATPase subunit
MADEVAPPDPARIAAKGIAAFIGSDVVVDTDGGHIVIGRLEAAEAGFVVIADADVHAMDDSRATREIYTLEAAKHGIRANRRRAIVPFGRVVAVSLLADVIRY